MLCRFVCCTLYIRVFCNAMWHRWRYRWTSTWWVTGVMSPQAVQYRCSVHVTHSNHKAEVICAASYSRVGMAKRCWRNTGSVHLSGIQSDGLTQQSGSITCHNGHRSAPNAKRPILRVYGVVAILHRIDVAPSYGHPLSSSEDCQLP
jgi:hypothetical protein